MMGAADRNRTRRQAGLSIVEMLVSLVIGALLLTAVTVALNASFYAYAAASQSASAQSGSRLVMQRLTTMIRTSSLHDAYDPGNPLMALQPPSLPPVQSVGVQMLRPGGELIQVWWEENTVYGNADLGDLWYSSNGSTKQMLLTRVQCQRGAGSEPYLFTLASRQTVNGLILTRATIDLTIHGDPDNTLALEGKIPESQVIRLVGSVVPRRNIE